MDNYIEDGEDSLRETAERVKDACEYTHEQYEKEPKPVAKTKALVTGGAGFIGSRLVKELLRVGYDVVVLDNMSTGKESFLAKKATLVRGDCRDYETVFKTIEEHEPFVVFHLAAQSKVLPSLKKGVDFVQFSIEQNVLATENVLKAIVQTRHASSDSGDGSANAKYVDKKINLRGCTILNITRREKVSKAFRNSFTPGLRRFMGTT